MGDPVRQLGHDHADINRRVLILASIMAELERGGRVPVPESLVAALDALREALFLHFAREEEGLFPFVIEALPELGTQVREMETGHDAICGALARMFELARAKTEVTAIAPLFHRFETAYAEHARVEAAVLQVLAERLDDAQRVRLAALVKGL